MRALVAELEKLKALVGTLPRRRIVPREQDRPTFKALAHVLKTWDVAVRPTEESGGPVRPSWSRARR